MAIMHLVAISAAADNTLLLGFTAQLHGPLLRTSLMRSRSLLGVAPPVPPPRMYPSHIAALARL